VEWGEFLQVLGDRGVGFHLVLHEQCKNHSPRLTLILDQKWEDLITDEVKKHFDGVIQPYFKMTSPVGMIFFHGPHYGDRYGIADAVFKAMADRAIPLLTAGFSGSAVYLVLEEKMIQKARKILEEVFVVPQGNRGRLSP
jgi:aspartokinase